jgi:acyl-coenzyme A synthetase/AMP-(fatty) acid ligase
MAAAAAPLPARAVSFAPIAHVFAHERAHDSVVGWRAGAPVTWSDFRARVAALAAHLDADAVLACEKPLNFLAALLALWSRGHTALVPPNLQPAAVSAIAGRVLRDTDVENTTGSVTLSLPAAARCRLALYTSGSSGAPKRVDKTLAQLDRELENLHALWGGVLAQSSVLATVPHHHIYGLLFRLLLPLAAGRPADEATSVDPVELRAAAARRGRHVLVSTPAHLSRFPELLAPAQWHRPEMIFSSGGPLAAQTAALYRAAFGAAPVEVFGSTETGGVAWRRRDGGAHEDVWQTFPGISVGTDADGALLLDSPYLPTRSWRMDDGATLLGDGRFVLLGRLDRVVKIEGKRLSLPELEQRLQEHEWIETAAAVPLPAPQRLGVVLVPSRDGASALERLGARAFGRALRKHLAPRFDATLLPKRFRFVNELPVSERGKVVSQELVQLFARES